MIELKRDLLGRPKCLAYRLFRAKALWLSRCSRQPLGRDIDRILYRALTDRNRGGVLHLAGFEMAYRNALSFYIEAFYIWHKRIYDFRAPGRVSYILDCGASIGTSALYFRRRYPDAQIVAFEPDPEKFHLLATNVADNHVVGVDTVKAALAQEEGSAWFVRSGGHGGHLVSQSSEESIEVPVRRLSQWVDREVDILKMNIEGGESEVFHEMEPCIQRCRNIVFEYHHVPGQDASLHEILDLLHRNGFLYAVNDFGPLISPGLQPPLEITAETKYYLLVFASRRP